MVIPLDSEELDDLDVDQAGELLHLLMGISNEHHAQPDDPATFLRRVTEGVLNRAYRMGQRDGLRNLRTVLSDVAATRALADDDRYAPALEDVADRMGLERFGL